MECTIPLLIMPGICISGSRNVQIEAVQAGAHFHTLHGHTQQDLIPTCAICSWLLFQPPIQFPAGCLGSHTVSCGVLWTGPQGGERKVSRDDPVPKARQNTRKLPPKSSCASFFWHHLHLSLLLFISTKGNPCSRSSRHVDLGLFKLYKIV